ncbi:hypothetical protein H7J07_08060 [Mycobacterium koreense]|uniref:Uncharacterized protein n=1 Tax=Mycolicibacillus koreensis TaxID=1069220 RepID=A0A7I7SE92_9MYCO|nr:hypothetical protein [Mycolicibacillus koreensis]MCV7248172.1 hypothetical protein [Mycolicibacillus koreensis]ODR08055.1 hypothetical protein BHQ15_09855 [Mycolicibacillus koreensis]OSC35718.1 hypothetical protein B8W67_01175 [Mycolicibacillus koreensis]BBY55108.1 hypothetical protein MKOR_23590 [Mycolicibacillus koreensis]
MVGGPRCQRHCVKSGPRCRTRHPDKPRFGSAAEEHVWKLLEKQLRDTDLIIAGQRVTDHLKDHEVDIVAALNGAPGP